MKKKEYLIKILDNLVPVRDLALWLKIIVEQWALWNNVLDTLIGAVESGIHAASSEVTKMKMKKWLDSLTRMKRIEKQSAMRDEKDLAELDSLIDSF